MSACRTARPRALTIGFRGATVSRLVINLKDSRPLWSLPGWAEEEIRAAVPERFDVLVVEANADGRGDGGSPSPEAIRAMAGAEVHLGYGFPAALFEAARASGDTLRWVHSASAGVGGALYPAMAGSDVALTNSAGIHAEPIADTIIGMIHHFARGLDYAVRGQAERRWWKAPFEAAGFGVREIEGLTVGIVGYGGIGRATARRATALGMRVLAYRRRDLPADPGVQLLTGPVGLDRLLSESDFVVLTIPRTRDTNDLLNRQRIAILRPEAVVINVGRGELVDETALAEALQNGRIRGAGLDVFRREPLPPDSPLWDLPNVLITPHVSATTDRFWRREVDLIVENLRRYEAGEPLRNEVDKRAGY